MADYEIHQAWRVTKKRFNADGTVVLWGVPDGIESPAVEVVVRMVAGPVQQEVYLWRDREWSRYYTLPKRRRRAGSERLLLRQRGKVGI